ncbi:hypothetical protein FUAX_50220 (plasmid) [Fulvitalea axinellae]|uniref:DUF3307 domain-containing protein n=1 Tax=Fulvitalea axinellae TaxID=1182444 RepID=A0AAU9CTQ4_9BACT|nr:hypothetical protein FUAX_50220 [Fulvitalea axinellae]
MVCETALSAMTAFLISYLTIIFLLSFHLLFDFYGLKIGFPFINYR